MLEVEFSNTYQHRQKVSSVILTSSIDYEIGYFLLALFAGTCIIDRTLNSSKDFS